MQSPSYTSGLEWDRPRARHMWAAVMAVIGSVVLHAVAIQRFPPVPVGQPPRMDEAGRIRPVLLGDVRTAVQERSERPGRFQAHDPQWIVTEAVALDAFREVLEAVMPAEPPDMGVTLAGEERAVAELEVERDVQPWDPRQDIVQIRDRIVPDEVAALPRRVTHDLDRRLEAPDIALPQETPGLSLAARGEGWMDVATGQRTDGSRHGALAGAAGDGDDLDAKPSPLLKGMEVLQEVSADITDAQPIEQLLSLEIRTHLDPADPNYEYVELLIRHSGPDVLPVLPKDVLLLQDASASMTQASVDRSKEGLHRWLDRLQPGDRFDVIAFRDDISRAFGDVSSFDLISKSRAAFFIEELRAQGGTDVFASLQALLDLPSQTDRPLIAVMISDGVPTEGVIDSTDIIGQFSTANQGRVSVFAVGGGRRVNRYLLDFLSYKNRGDAKITDNNAAIPESLDRLAVELSRPVLTDLRWNLAGGETMEMYPRMLTHLYLDRPLVIYGRKPTSASSAVLYIVGRSGADMKDMVFELDFDVARKGTSEIRSNWAWQKVYHLVGEHIQTRDVAHLDALRRIAADYKLDIQYGADAVPPRL